jgi:hypothetical protein
MNPRKSSKKKLEALHPKKPPPKKNEPRRCGICGELITPSEPRKKLPGTEIYVHTRCLKDRKEAADELLQFPQENE